MKNIVLFGFMGTGKTTVGKILSKKLNLPLLDMDSIISEEEEKTINSIFAESGEKYFRDLENKLTHRLSKYSGKIISTGGGIVLNEENINLYKNNGLLVCLEASPEKIVERLKNDKSRPLLEFENNEKEAEIKCLLENRKSLYDKIDFKIKTDLKHPELVANEIINKYNEDS